MARKILVRFADSSFLYTRLCFLRFFPTRLLALTAMMASPYFSIYFTALDLKQFAIEGEYFRWIFYFSIILFGAYLAQASALRRHHARDAILLLANVTFYFAVTLLCSKGLISNWQFILHILTFPFLFYSFHLFSNPTRLARLRKMRCYAVVSLFGALSLEAYLVQSYLIHWIAAQHMSFYLSMMVIWALIFISAYLASTIFTRVLGLFRYKNGTAKLLVPKLSTSKGVS